MKESFGEEGGPGPEVELSKRRIPAMHFLDGDFEVHDSDDYDENDGTTPFIEPVSGEMRTWT